jgi:diguanylate cyclase (GGDEF)-like protein
MRIVLIQSLLATLLLFPPLCAHAQQVSLQSFGQNEGLGNLAITALAQDASGYLWVGTENGLYRYNGEEFRRYGKGQGLPDPYITALHAGRNGALWASTYEGLYRLQHGRLVRVKHEGPLAAWPLQAMAEAESGELLLASEGRLLAIAAKGEQNAVRNYFDTATLDAHPELKAIESIYAEGGGSLWMTCKKKLCHASQGRIKVMGESDGLPADDWTSIARDKKGTLWIRSAKQILAMPKGSGTFEDRTPQADLMRKHLLRTELHVDANGDLLTNADPGLLRWHRGQWESYGKENGLSTGGGVTAILRDRTRGTWLATRGRGLLRWLGYGNWENWTSAQGLPDDVIISVLRDGQGRLHAGTRSGHAMLEPGARTFTTPDVLPALAGQQWASMAQDRNGRIWAATYTGMLLRYLPAASRTELVARMPMITQVLPDREGRMWLATAKGLRMLPDSAEPDAQPQAVEVPGPKSRHPENPVIAGCMDQRGELWFASLGDILHHDGKAWRVLPFGPLVDKGEFSILACSADGSLWGGTGTTLWRLRTQGELRAERIDASALRDRSVQTVFEDSRGWLWIGTDAGIAVWNRDRWRMLNQTHGLAWNDSNGRGFYEDRDGSMWAITSNGLSHILHPAALFEISPPAAVIEDAQRGGSVLDKGVVRLAWSSEPVVIRLASLNYEDRLGLRYRYRLAGMEDQWNESALPEMRYAALPAGEYRFQAMAVDSENGMQSKPVELVFSVAPPWWRSYPFYGLCAGAVLAAFLLFHRMRMLAHTRREAALEVLVQERTRELEQSQEALRVRALKDGLTRAWNRGAMMEMVEREIEKCMRTGECFVLALLDLDHFKSVNDTHGHLAGDAVLVEVARRLTASMRAYDSLGRYGGEEFMVMLPGLALPSGASRIEALRQAIREAPISIDGETSITVTASIGVVAFTPQSPDTVTELLRVADEALYRSKHEGRDRINYAAATLPVE